MNVCYVPAMTVSSKWYFPAVLGKSFNLRPLSRNSPLRCASSRMRSSERVNWFCNELADGFPCIVRSVAILVLLARLFSYIRVTYIQIDFLCLYTLPFAAQRTFVIYHRTSSLRFPLNHFCFASLISIIFTHPFCTTDEFLLHQSVAQCNRWLIAAPFHVLFVNFH